MDQVQIGGLPSIDYGGWSNEIKNIKKITRKDFIQYNNTFNGKISSKEVETQSQIC